jgi:hypothetical protein
MLKSGMECDIGCPEQCALKNIRNRVDAVKAAAALMPSANPNFGINSFTTRKADTQVIQTIKVVNGEASMGCRTFNEDGSFTLNANKEFAIEADPKGNPIQQAILTHLGQRLIEEGSEMKVPYDEFISEPLCASVAGIRNVIDGRYESSNKGAFCMETVSHGGGNFTIVPNSELVRLLDQEIPLEVALAHMCHAHSGTKNYPKRTNCFYHTDCRSGCGILRTLNIDPSQTKALTEKTNIAGSPEAYTTANLEEFWKYVQRLNRNRRTRLRTLLTEDIKLSETEAIILVGSDGKGERQYQSKSDMVCLGVNTFDPDLINYAYSKLDNAGIINTIESYSDASKAVYLLNSQSPLSYVRGNSNSVYPDYLLHSRIVAGEDYLHQTIRLKIVEEMTARSEVGKRIREKMKDQLNLQRKIMAGGIYRDAVLFDENSQYYSERSPVSFGFKIPFLRTVQRRLDFALIDLVDPVNIENFDIENYPSATVDRIEYFVENGVIAKKEGREVREAYLWFLQRYHEIQNFYLHMQSPIKVNFDVNKFQHYSEIIRRFSFLKN